MVIVIIIAVLFFLLCETLLKTQLMQSHDTACNRMALHATRMRSYAIIITIITKVILVVIVFISKSAQTLACERIEAHYMASQSIVRHIDVYERIESLTNACKGTQLITRETNNMEFNNLRPYDYEIEKTVLSNIISDTEVLERAMELNLSPESFYDSRYRTICEHVLRLRKEFKPADAISLRNSLMMAEADKAITDTLTEVAGYYSPLADSERAILMLKEYDLRRKIIQLCESTGKDAGTLPVDDVLGELNQGLDSLLNYTSLDNTLNAHGIIESCLDAVKELKFGTGPTGISSGIPSLDAITSCWQPDELIILGARPSVGKTALAMSMALHAIQDGHKVGFFSVEMSTQRLGDRILANQSGIPGEKMRNRDDLTGEEWKMLEEVKTNPALQNLYINDTAPITITQLVATARKMVRRYGVEILFVDYLQLVRASKNYSTREQEVADVSRGLKACAKTLHIPVIALAQLSREHTRVGQGGEPELHDLRESGAIEQDADIIMLMSKDSINTNRKLNIAKNRNGKTEKITLENNASTMTFWETKDGNLGTPSNTDDLDDSDIDWSGTMV